MSSNKINRRSFISVTGKAALAIGVHQVLPISSFAQGLDDKTPGLYSDISFNQKPLPYSYAALEPYIDALTMEIHYSKHAFTYLKNLQDAIKEQKVESTISLLDLIKKASQFSLKIRNNAGGHFNHEFFWASMTDKKPQPSAEFMLVLQKSFGSYQQFITSFSDAAKKRFGSGWAWLIVNNQQQLSICSTANQDNPLMDLAEEKGLPILGLDVWEHAYYLKYQNKRADYIENWTKLINWPVVENRYKAALAQ